MKTVPQDSTSMAKIKGQDLCGKKKEELVKQLDDLKVELHGAEVTDGMASRLSKIRVVHKSIAIINQTQR